MARPRTNGPTERELQILHILWERGASSVRDVHTVLNQNSRVGYTSVQKIMQIMHDKKLVQRRSAGISHIYHAARSRDATQGAIVEDVLERVFKGSAMQLVARALAVTAASDEELEAIRALLEEKRD